MIKLSANQLKLVKDILLKYVPGYEVWVFGSRITKKVKPFSDLDLAIITEKPLPALTMALIKETFSESDLPFKVDILDWSQLDESFKQIINNQHEVF
jgi:uncharacterized protein